MNHPVTVGGLLLALAAILFGLAALFGLAQWITANMWPNGDDETVGPRGRNLWLIAGALCALCAYGIVR